MLLSPPMQTGEHNTNKVHSSRTPNIDVFNTVNVWSVFHSSAAIRKETETVSGMGLLLLHLIRVFETHTAVK